MKGKRILIWGTGNIANIIMNECPDLNPEFFVDSDINKCNSLFWGYKVIHPEEIEKWSEFTIIIATDYYYQIMMVYGERLKDCEVISYKDYISEVTDIENIINEAERFVTKLPKQQEKGKILFWGDIVGYDKGICKYLNSINEYDSDGLILFSEADGLTDDYISEKIKFTFFQLPILLRKNFVYEKDYLSKAISDFNEYVLSKEYLSKAALNLRLRHSNMGKNIENLICYYADICVRRVITEFKPKCVMIWNEFCAFHTIIAAICCEMDIPICYMEFGVLCGTFSIEKMGQMGESFPAVNYREFNKFDISEKDRDKASQVLEYLRQTNSNRHVQQDVSELERISSRIQKGKPVVFIAGQNDYESSLQPYDSISKEYHSPIFKSTDESVEYIAELAKKNDWNLIYKPHPIMTRFSGLQIVMPENVIIAYHCNVNRLIDLCDVCVTILSQVSYMSLVRERATVMLGYNQLRGSGAVYQAIDQNDIKTQIENAIEYGYTDEKKNAFIEHVARLNKYYLYDDMSTRKVQYGQSMDNLMIMLCE